MRKIAAAVFMLLVLAGCGNINRETLGMNKKAPNEFMVTTRPPLSLPPEYDLRPVVEPKQQASDDKDLSEGEEGLLERLSNSGKEAD